jgi:hypothetical protein
MDPDSDVDVAYSLHIKTWPDWVEAGEEGPEAGPDVHTSHMLVRSEKEASDTFSMESNSFLCQTAASETVL